ncbi:MAG: DNA replication/repair protein RecF [Actinobacteria bacterium]|nr:DNA replication/repair protein RecF [Actinomycetota bacterium]MBO0835803.1 DNA replication/repair protein RecF [Actinomycetota bacterium]
MYLSRLSLSDYRNYQVAEVPLEPGATTFVGANGQGKTNLLEAVGYLATFGSHRVGTDGPLVRQGADRAIVRGVVVSGGRDSLLEIEINAGRANRVRVNRAGVRPRNALGTLRCVLFAPEDTSIVKGDPDQRRRYLDDLLVSMRPRYAGVRADYDRVLRQRTALLKSAKARGAVPPGALEVWDDHLVTAGAVLTAGRLRLVAALRPLLFSSYSAVSGMQADTRLRYRMSANSDSGSAAGVAAASDRKLAEADQETAGDPDLDPDPDPDQEKLALALREALAVRRRAELERGVCLVGPHRDELELGIGGLPARGYASHGESWSLALALRLAAYQLLRREGEDPVLMLDDVFAELDSGRRDRLAGLVADAEQVLVTAAVAEDVPASLAGSRFGVEAGVVTSG